MPTQKAKKLGKECTPSLEKFLADPSRDVFARITVADSLKTVAEQYPETRDSTVATLVGELEKFRENDPGLNGFLICALVDLQATETIKTIRRAFQADRVDRLWLAIGKTYKWNWVSNPVGKFRSNPFPT